MASYLIWLLITLQAGGVLYERVQFSEEDLLIKPGPKYTRLTLRGGSIWTPTGYPQVPSYPVYIALPPGTRVSGIEAIPSRCDTIKIPSPLLPGQPPRILYKEAGFELVRPDPVIYGSSKPYPGILVALKKGEGIAELLIHPIQYLPQAGKVLFYSELELRIDYTQGKKSPHSPLPKKELLKKLVVNPELVKISPSEPGFEYLILTQPPMDTVFKRLADWKREKGVRAVVRNLDDLAGYPGRDHPERIRNYLKIAYEDSGLYWVLLGGDVEIIPMRYAYAMTCSAGYHPREDYLPCDLYYADLNGDWDRNQNGIFGEVADSVDLYPEVMVGRAPVRSTAEAQRFVEKVLRYEKNPPLDYEDNILFCAEILWTNPLTDAGIAKDLIQEHWLPQGLEVTKLYESLGNEAPGSVLAAIEAGQGLINHDGHGWINLMGVGAGALTNEDMDTLHNEPKNGILYSIGCWTGAFDYDCIGEHFLCSPEGGGIGYIGNSSYGWGSPGNPGYGYSDRFDEEFYRKLFKEEISHLGEVLALSKAHFIAYSREANVYRWHQYQLNLLGDPELRVWTEPPKEMEVSHPEEIPVGESEVWVKVVGPDSGAVGCLTKDGEVYERGVAGIGGQLSFIVEPATPGGLKLTVTAPNFLPYEAELMVLPDGPYITCPEVLILDENGDGIPNPGEGVEYSIWFKNWGSIGVSNLQARLESSDPRITILDSLVELGNLGARDSVFAERAFKLEITKSCADRTIIPLQFILDANSYQDTIPSSLIIGAPELSYHSSGCFDLEGNHKIPEPGNELLLGVATHNQGLGWAYGSWAKLISLSPYIEVLNDSLYFGDILPDSIKSSARFARFRVSSDCPSPYRTDLKLQFFAREYESEDSLVLMVGPTGLFQEFEAGLSGWEIGGTEGLGMISTRDAHSPVHSFYFGEDGDYPPNSDAWLCSPQFMVGPSPTLRFWRKFGLPIYGTDGLYLEVYDGGRWDTLDFIGSGGALPLTGIESDWAEESYTLPYEAGQVLKLRFRFVSDWDERTGEGFYIDDIRVGSSTSIEEITSPPDRLVLHQNRPNPFNRSTTINFELPKLAEVSLKVYDVSGRLVRTLVNETRHLEPGFYSILWNGEDEHGRPLSAGVYFYQLKVASTKPQAFTRKLVLVR